MRISQIGIVIALAVGMFAASSGMAVASDISFSGVRDCKLVDVAAFTNRVHVHCQHDPSWPGLGLSSPLIQNVEYFAIELSNPMSAHATWLGTWALLNGRTVSIFYVYNPNQNPPGCNPNDCMRMTGIEVH